MAGRRTASGLGTGSEQCGKGEVQPGLSVPLGCWPWASQTALVPNVPNTACAAVTAASGEGGQLWDRLSFGCFVIPSVEGASQWWIMIILCFVMQGEEVSVQV